MAEYIDRNKIRWFGCDWENHCDEYNNDCSKCPHGECEHDQVVSIPLADVIEREKIDKAIEEIKGQFYVLLKDETSIEELWWNNALEKSLEILKRNIGE